MDYLDVWLHVRACGATPNPPWTARHCTGPTLSTHTHTHVTADESRGSPHPPNSKLRPGIPERYIVACVAYMQQ